MSDVSDAFRRGAEAMQKSAVDECVRLASSQQGMIEGEIWCLHHAAKAIRALPIPKDDE